MVTSQLTKRDLAHLEYAADLIDGVRANLNTDEYECPDCHCVRHLRWPEKNIEPQLRGMVTKLRGLRTAELFAHLREPEPEA